MIGNIILIGMMGCGKSSVGRILSERLGLALSDSDKLIEARERRSIPEIFAEEGEAYFREKELEVSRELGRRSGQIVACGGGLPLRDACILALRERGTVFFLLRDPGETYDSVSMANRPLAQEGREAFIARFERREPVYRKWADYVIRGRSARDAAGRIEEIYIRENQP